MQPKPSFNPPWRITIDLKRVNAQLSANQWPMPRLDELALHMNGHSYLGSTDAQGGYWQLLLHEESLELFCLKTDSGTFTPTRIPQGSVDAVQWFHGQLHSLFTDMIPNYILQWIVHDFVLHSESFDRHFQVWDRYFKTCLTNICLSPK